MKNFFLGFLLGAAIFTFVGNLWGTAQLKEFEFYRDELLTIYRELSDAKYKVIKVQDETILRLRGLLGDIEVRKGPPKKPPLKKLPKAEG